MEGILRLAVQALLLSLFLFSPVFLVALVEALGEGLKALAKGLKGGKGAA